MPRLLLPAKPKAGQTFASRYTPTGDTRLYEETIQVAKLDDTPAIPYDPKLTALHVDRVTAAGSSSSQVESLWFAPNVGLVKWVKPDGETLVLKQYAPSK